MADNKVTNPAGMQGYIAAGAGNVGQPGSEATIVGPAETQKFIDVIVKYGQNGVDTSRIYGNGTSESVIGQLDLHGLPVDTKIYPLNPGDHAPARLKELFKTSLDALTPHKVRILYLHAPDRSVPYEDTLEAVNQLYQQGHFGGFLTGKHLSPDSPNEGTHFDPKWSLAKAFISRYGHTTSAVLELKEVTDKYQLSLAEVALRWLQHHSLLVPEDLGVVVGASRPAQLEKALLDR
ncbi:hypothetical protein PHLCEN_2v12356 [Hermanssonia centrifuga]|uniref:NADP-dependent oxidoreductase domain-containing protein n=1 Tax=Hermanssonia centrifuga TaxID=98765 RepID=A0A2R6NIG0_9APHY|nr:hypothetical protein PHLCEN_2v12356 [Hermanssonia centrifuga]